MLLLKHYILLYLQSFLINYIHLNQIAKKHVFIRIVSYSHLFEIYIKIKELSHTLGFPPYRNNIKIDALQNVQRLVL